MRFHRSERSLTWPLVIVVCMYLNMHRVTALICVHVVRQLATLLNKFKLTNYMSKWKLIILYCSFCNSDSVEVM
jgi:hypothetical protein